MSDQEKIEAFDRIQKELWLMVNGHTLQSILAAQLVRTLRVPGPNGEDPESA